MFNEPPSARFPPLTLEDLSSSIQRHQPNRSMESDFDMSHSKLRYLGVDISSLQHQDPMEVSYQVERPSQQRQKRKYESGDSTQNVTKLQDHSDISLRMDHFRQKIQEIQQDLESMHTRSPTSDPYKISLRSLRNGEQQQKQPKRPYEPILETSQQLPQQQPYRSAYQQSYFNQSKGQSSVTSGGLSFQPPSLFNTSNKKYLPSTTPKSQLSELEIHRIKYYDSFLPSEQRIMSCPYKLFKHKMQRNNMQALTRCLEDFNIMDSELTSSLR